MSNEPIILIDNISKKYKNSSTYANENISLSIKPGEVFGLLGANGAGKSTLVRQIAGFVQPTKGNIKLYNFDLTKEPHLANQFVALQPQNIWLPAQTKPKELLELTGRLRGLSIIRAKEEAENFIEEFKLTEHIEKKLQELSGGLKRLVAIAVTLIGDRPIVVLDEPTNDLDPSIRRVVWKRIKTTAQSGRTVILVTHNVIEAEHTLDRVSIINKGRVLATGTPMELKEKFEQLLRLEITARPNTENDLAKILARWNTTVKIGESSFFLTVPKNEIEKTFSYLLPYMEQFQDFRIITTNLEDIYFELSGGERIEG
ncbi:ABC-2 type transport system ATP-binding protein [Alkalihalobacillus xiaoxiensis]|uniref:ABC-2 type transport system ATP-binding protein n=1 Tax=Shouchella xiaoxiensis TaxID=766895 RepID=A0ABS2SY05_9BACI|nr:ABC transporter ATP-binding protein [Shouchella xiaoxiensis]MBM7839127.1 ABC-2 type transport system ATP-binding protein [Shouchella xiaoxiensis]